MRLQHIKDNLPPEKRFDVDAELASYRAAGGPDDLERFVYHLREQGKISPEVFCAIHGAKEIETSLSDQDKDGRLDFVDSTSSSYALLGRLGKGAMGEVHVARDQSLLRKVAYKKMLPQIAKNPRLLARFWNEVQVTSQLDHPNILPVYGVEVGEGGSTGYAMKLIQGRSLTAVIEEARRAHKAGRVTDEAEALAERLDYFLRVCDALAYAHAKRVIHRDLKPDNIMIGKYGEVYVVDWGICRVMGKRDIAPGEAGESEPGPEVEPSLRTQDGAAIGTPRYMSPEQAQGKHDLLDGRSDLYALGLILFELVALRPSTAGKSVQEALVNAYDGQKEPLVHVNPAQKIAPAMAAIIAKATAKEPQDRYATVEALAEDIRRYLRDEEVSALPDTSMTRLLRWVSKHRAATLTALAISLAVGLTAVIGVISYQRAGEAERQARLLAEQKEGAERQARLLGEQNAQLEERERLALTLRLARESRDRDPGKTLSYLKDLSADPKFTEWGRARILAADALSRGIADTLSAPWLDPGRGHQKAILALLAAPDGAWLLSAGADAAIKRWDLSCNKPGSPRQVCGEPRAFVGHSAPVTQLVLSPDGAALASASQDHSARLWDAKTGTARHVLTHTAPVLSLAFSPDGATLATASADKTVILWSVSSGAAQRTLGPFSAEVSRVAFSPDGATLVGVSGAALWRWELGDEGAPETLTGTAEKLRALAFSPDGEWLAAAGEANKIWLWRGGDTKPRATLEGHAWAVRDLAFSPDGATLASASEDRSVRLWEMAACARGDCESFTLGQHQGSALALRFSPDGSLLASYGRDQVIRLWDVSTGELSRAFTGHEGLLRAMAFSEGGAVIVSAGDDLSIRAWPIERGRRAFLAHDTAAFSVAASSRWLATGGEDGKIKLWAYGESSPRAVFEAKGAIWALDFSPDGARLAAASEAGLVSWWDVTPEFLASSREEGEAVTSFSADDALAFFGDETRSYYAVRVSNDGRTVFAGGDDGVIESWDAASFAPGVVMKGHEKAVHGLTVSPDGTTLASTGSDGMIRLWALPAGTLRATVDAQGDVRKDFSDLTFSPDGSLLAAGNYAAEIQLYRVEGPDTLAPLTTLRIHQGEIEELAFSPDGQTLASASWDGTIRLTHLSPETLAGEAPPESRAIQGYGREIDGVAFVPSGQALAFVSEDGFLFLTQDDLPSEPAQLQDFLQKLSLPLANAK